MVSRDPRISPSIGMIATLAPKTSPRVVVSLFPIIAIVTPRSIMPMKTIRQPLNAPRKKTPARDLRGVGTTTGSTTGLAGASPGAATGSSSVMRSALRRGLRGRSGFGFRFDFDGMLRRRRLLVLRDLGLGQRLDVARGKTDFLVRPVDLDDARANGFADVKGLVELRFRIARDLGDVREPFHAVGHANEETEVGDFGNRSDQLIADVVRLREVVPLVRQELFDRERQTLILAVDADHARLHRVALLQHLVRMLQAAVPRHVRDVNQSVDAVFNFNECAEISEVADLARDDGADWITLRDGVPRILFE